MAGFDRSAFKGVSSSRRKKQMEQVEEKSGIKGSSNSEGRPLKIEEGKNYFRVFPIHPKTIENLGEDDASNMFPFSRFYMDTLVSYVKQGEEIEEIQRRSHLNSMIHGGTEKDLSDQYINFAHKVAYEDFDDDDERKEFLSAIKHYQTGITRSVKWPCYVKMYSDKKKKSFVRGTVLLPVSVINKMNEQSAENDDPEDVIETDIFSDTDDGFVMIVTKDSGAGKKDPGKYYSVAVDIKGGADPLEDEDLEWLMEQVPLDEKYGDIYKPSDFQKTLKALKAFDEKDHGKDKELVYGFFGEDEFLDIVEEISKYYPETDEDSEKEVVTAKESKKESAVKKSKKEEEPSDLPFDMDLEDMDKSQLEGYIRRNDLSIRVSKRHTAEDLLEFIQEEEEIAAQSATTANEAREEEAEDPKPARGGRGRNRLDKLAEGLE